jgi:hypothetical protein
MGKNLALLTLWTGLTISLWAGGIRYGMSRAEVETALGKPVSVLSQGPRLILLYPKSGRVELEQGVVVKLTGVPVEDEPPAPPPPAAAAKPTPSKENAARAAAEAKIEKARQENQRLIEEATEKLAESHNKVPLVIGPSPRQFWSTLVAGLVFRTLVTVVVLKIAFKWNDMHADWGQMYLPALADTATQAGIGAAAYTLWRADHLFYVDAAVSYFVLLGVLMKTTHACTLQRAVAVAGAAKLSSLVMWALISVVLLNLLT